MSLKTQAQVCSAFAAALVLGGTPAAGETMLALVNARLNAWELPLRVSRAEYVTDARTGFAGGTILFADHGNKHLEEHFVPGDPRRGYRTDIRWAIDGAELTEPLLGETTATDDEAIAAISAAMATWDDVRCAQIPLQPIREDLEVQIEEGVVQDPGLGLIQDLLGFSDGELWPFRDGDVLADINHAGFLPMAFFESLIPGGGELILGVTFTFVWEDSQGPTDVDGDGRWDVAFREIYYNDYFPWSVTIPGSVDIETIALHESGHGLSQDHFGRLVLNGRTGNIVASPYAVMNAGLYSPIRELTGNDVGGHCSIWADWPLY